MNAGTSKTAPKSGPRKPIKGRKPIFRKSRLDSASGSESEESLSDNDRRDNDSGDDTGDMEEHPNPGVHKLGKMPKRRLRGSRTGDRERDDEEEDAAEPEAPGGSRDAGRDKVEPSPEAAAAEARAMKMRMKKLLKKYKAYNIPAVPEEDSDDVEFDPESFDRSMADVEAQMTEAAPLPAEARAEMLKDVHKQHKAAIETVQKSLGPLGGALVAVAGGLALAVASRGLRIVDLESPDAGQGPKEPSQPKKASKARPSPTSPLVEDLRRYLGDAVEELDLDIDEEVLETFEEYKTLAAYKLSTNPSPKF